MTKSGYFKGYRSFCANASRNMVAIKLVPRVLAGTIEAAPGGSITLSNTTAINFQQNSIVIKSTGAAYGGTVNVYASYIDPTNTDISLTVPGSFMGTDTGNLYVLKSTGMLAIEMESTAGEPLQLAPNKPATVKLSIPASLVSKVPNTIDTWSLNEKGVWEKEGTAVKTGDHYEFLAEHFSFWNCDQPSAAIYLSLHVQDNAGISLLGTIVNLTVINNGWANTRSGITDSYGNVSGLVFASVPIELNIVPNSYQCMSSPNTLYTETIGPFTSNASLIISATLASQQNNLYVLAVTGNANDCNGQPLQSGYAIITNGSGSTYANVIDGQYTGFLSGCDTINSINVKVSDNNTNAASTFSTYSVSGNTITVPTITLNCPFFGLNIYDGIYSVESGWTTRYDASGVPLGDALSGDLTGNPDVYLITTGSNSVGIPAPGPANGGGYLYWAAGSSSAVAGIDGLEVTVDPTTNNTNIASASLANLANWAGQPNTYDPATQTVHLSFNWTNTAGALREYEIVLKYKQPRP